MMSVRFVGLLVIILVGFMVVVLLCLFCGNWLLCSGYLVCLYFGLRLLRCYWLCVFVNLCFVCFQRL